jgi:hypothetical protein
MKINKKKSLQTIDKELLRLGDKHRLAAKWIKISQHFLEDVAIVPSKDDLEKIEKKGIKVKNIKNKSWESCLDGYEVVSDLRGEEATAYSNGLILKQKGKHFYAACVDFYDTGSEFADALDTFIDRFEQTIKITKHASEKGVTLPVHDIHICFHSSGYMGYIIFEATPTMKTWHEYTSGDIKGNFWSLKNRKTIAQKSTDIIPNAMKHIQQMHDAGIILAFRGYGWIDTSSIILDFDEKGKPRSIFPINFISSVLIEDVVKDSIKKDFEILDRLKNYSEDSYIVRDKAAELSAMKMVDEGLLK